MPVWEAVGAVVALRAKAVLLVIGGLVGRIVVELKPIPLGPILIVALPMTSVVGVAPEPMGYVVPLMITSVGSTVIAIPSTVVTVADGPGVLVGRLAVVPAMPIPLGPMVTTCPLMLVVIGTEPAPIRYVFPPITASEGERENVKSPRVTTEKLGSAGNGTVVVARPIPFGPMLMVWPLMTVVVGEPPGLIVNV